MASGIFCTFKNNLAKKTNLDALIPYKRKFSWYGNFMDFAVTRGTAKFSSMKICWFATIRVVHQCMLGTHAGPGKKTTISFTLSSCICGYHVCKDIWNLPVGETVTCEREAINPEDHDRATTFKMNEWQLQCHLQRIPQ